MLVRWGAMFSGFHTILRLRIALQNFYGACLGDAGKARKGDLQVCGPAETFTTFRITSPVDSTRLATANTGSIGSEAVSIAWAISLSST